jgi:biotin transport system substrate-specific component
MAAAGLFRPKVKQWALLYDGMLVLGGSLFIALSAQITVPMWPVPMTGQTLAVLMFSALLGARLGLLTVLLYLTEGVTGLPVFAQARGGLPVLLGPTGGYLLGFLGAAFVVGTLTDYGWDRRIHTTLLAMLLGNLVIYTCGLIWLTGFVGPGSVLAVGLYPFLGGEWLKMLLAALALPWGWRLLQRKRP